MDGVIPVIDLKQGQVVHAIAGDRDHYRPISSQLPCDATPRSVAKAFVQYGFKTVYVADLDAILGVGDNDHSIQAIRDAGLHVWLDRGIRAGNEAVRAIEVEEDYDER